MAREFTRPAARRARPLSLGYLSGDSGDSLPQQGIPDGPGNFVQKPFTSDVLLDRVRHLLSSP